VLQALDAEERATLWRLLGRALYAAEPAIAPDQVNDQTYAAPTASISS